MRAVANRENEHSALVAKYRLYTVSILEPLVTRITLFYKPLI